MGLAILRPFMTSIFHIRNQGQQQSGRELISLETMNSERVLLILSVCSAVAKLSTVLPTSSGLETLSA